MPHNTDQAPPSLRERKRLAAMRHIQEVALDLWDAQGFDAVTVSEIARGAQVSAGSIYNYFGTKEGILLQGLGEDAFLDRVIRLTRTCDLRTALRKALVAGEADLLNIAAETSARRLTHIVRHSGTYAALLVAVDQAVRLFTAELSSPDHPAPVSPSHARIEASAVIWAVFAAIMAWREEPAGRTVTDAILEALSRIEVAR